MQADDKGIKGKTCMSAHIMKVLSYRRGLAERFDEYLYFML